MADPLPPDSPLRADVPRAGSDRPPRPAASIILVRDGASGLECFMVVRHHQIDFASGAMVFPGGKVDAADAAARAFVCRGEGRGQGRDQRSGQGSGQECGEGEDDLDFRIAAIREAFEEAGVLLARRGAGVDGALIDGAEAKALAHWRDPLARGETTAQALCEAAGLRLAVDALAPFAHWITPEGIPKRFDTRFYLAAAPVDHVALHDGSEGVDSLWVRPQDALDHWRRGECVMLFPTRLNLARLAESADAAAALRDAARRPMAPVQPRVSKRDGELWVAIDAVAGFPASEAPLKEDLGQKTA